MKFPLHRSGQSSYRKEWIYKHTMYTHKNECMHVRTESYFFISSNFMYSNAICNRRIREIFSSHPDIAVTHMSRLHWETVYQNAWQWPIYRSNKYLSQYASTWKKCSRGATPHSNWILDNRSHIMCLPSL